MTTEVDIRRPLYRDDAWEGFATGPWTERIDVRDVILKDFTPWGRRPFPAGCLGR